MSVGAATFSAVVLTYNEEKNLPHCLASLEGLDDVVVFDSHSRDGTCEIARRAGARVLQRTFTGYADQCNAALSEVAYKHPWVLMLDADETLPPDLHLEIEAVLASVPAEVTLFRMRRKDFFNGRWLRYSSGYPTWFARLLRPGRAAFAREINPVCRTDGQVRELQGHIEHHPLRRGLEYWFYRHNQYSSKEASLYNETARSLKWRDLFSRDAVARRAALKAFSYRLPFRPLLVFVWLFVVRRGFLDGANGWRFASMRFVYELMIEIKRSPAE